MSAATAVASPPLQVGDVVADRYRVVGELGAGGMGRVLEVEHVELGRRLALKLIRPERWDEVLVRRFRREARAVARIDSPLVAQVTDFGVDAAVGPFYVMERLDGETLDQRLTRGGALHTAEALELLAELADALAAVHEAGIVHRDLKPSNVGLCTRGPVRVKLIDFGLAASIDDAYLERLTQSQQVLGSLPYMAPEQFHGAAPAPTLDLWSLGVLAFETLTGRLPYSAPSTAALIHQILTAPVPPLRPQGLPVEIEAVLARLLAKSPADRYASARDAAQELRRCSPSPAAGRPFTNTTTAEIGPTAAWETPVEPVSPEAESGVRTGHRQARRRRARLAGTVLGTVGLVALAAALAGPGGAPEEEPPAPDDVPGQATEASAEESVPPRLDEPPSALTMQDDPQEPKTAPGEGGAAEEPTPDDQGRASSPGERPSGTPGERPTGAARGDAPREGAAPAPARPARRSRRGPQPPRRPSRAAPPSEPATAGSSPVEVPESPWNGQTHEPEPDEPWSGDIITSPR